MRLSEAIMELEEYYDKVYQAYGYTIEVAMKKENHCAFIVSETHPVGGIDYSSIIITENGVMLNEYGNDIIELGLDAYDNDQEMVRKLTNLKKKWYKEA